MKKFVIYVAIALLPLSVSAFDSYGMAGAGTLMTHGQTGQFGLWAGTETPLSGDSSHYGVVQRTGYYYQDGTSDIQGVSMFILNKTSLGLWNRVGLYGAAGGGFLYQINEGADDNSAALKFELGLDIWGSLGLAVGCDYVPVSGDYDKAFVYGLIDLTPKLK